MLKEQKFFICNTCGNIVGMVFDSGVNVVCCGEEMEELVPNTVEASVEKHLPVVEIEGNLVKVNVGSADHPMIPEHYIEWIYIQTEKGGQRKNLSPGEAPNAVFALENDKVVAAYAYCNLHGLWKTAIE
ncbi:MAG TPA: desulfoferrodoxin family protein [Candidatus Avimonas sp.]|jgi:superoxide reductase|nr:desulfoferrodoxin [Clostridiales bacterium]HOB35871.1 desulfoferrodoxin family protein [Candidatus Avimonas sp.]HQA15397.1 desulfoferrodoxin family protein [Candidatus Avimonas sp.]HQD37357.1 desulfoferrodoxin family protein [Candidatus Avimonas sp.]